MARTPTERLLQQQIQTLFPRLSRHWRRALTRWVLGALLAGSAHRPALAPALATAGIAPCRHPGGRLGRLDRRPGPSH
jgi:hypothetical protein